MDNEQYSKKRETLRKQIIELRKSRRVEAGKNLSFTFENRETVKYQIQEMMRVEHITEEAKIQHEIDIYNDLVPEPGTLSATMFIEIPDPEKIRSTLDSMQGLDNPQTVYLQVDEKKSYAEFEAGHSREDRISAVHYVKFRLNSQQIKNFQEATVKLVIAHKSYQASVELSADQKRALAADLV